MSRKDLNLRIQQHLKKQLSNAYTSKANDWEVFFEKSKIESMLPRKIEVHIKKMKSRKYFESLLSLPKIVEELAI